MVQTSSRLRIGIRLMLSASMLLVTLAAYGQNSLPPAKRPITVTDGIEMTRIVLDESNPDTNGKAASFSPNGKQFIVVRRKGNLGQDTNDQSLLLYLTADTFHAPKPEILLEMCTSSVREAIRQIRWLADNDTLIFLGENTGEVSQVYSFQISTRTLKKLTNQPTAVSTYDITRDGHILAFIAAPPPRKALDTEHDHAREIVVEQQELDRIVAGDYVAPEADKVFWQVTGSSPHPVPVDQGFFPRRGGSIYLSPDGRYLLFSAALGNGQVRPEWAAYRDEFLQQILTAKSPRNTISALRQYVLFDSQNMSSSLLLNSPTVGSGAVSWSTDAKSVFVHSYLPLDVTDTMERKAREQAQYPVEVKLPAREYQRLAKEGFPAKRIQGPPIEVALEQDVNTAPKLYVTDPKSHQKTLLLDPNPQFSELEFGWVETIEWEVSGAKILGGLYLPPDYRPGKRYPLVIQTHGFEPKTFSMDGRSEWSSGFAARPLAARGILVLQAHDWKDREKDHDRISDDRSLGATAQESHKNFNALLYQGAIDFLDSKGMIDRNRVGIIGFSRTVCFVAYTLTHSKERFAAASLVDGIGCGYFDEMVSPSIAWDSNALNGGASPFGEGLKLWMKNSPGFNLDKVITPVRLVALGKSSVLGDLWQWYAGLSLLKKPVDLVVIPDGSHIYGKPSECRLKQQGLLDWFTFWLKGEEDPNPAKSGQYARWGELRRETAAPSLTVK
jgi:dipeptidyl aminopeptidase/acylaminoacyl peptidase